MGDEDTERAAPTKVVIVGGGPSGISTAFHLLDGNERADEIDLTVYQLGWRLGGKGATGRTEGDERILEHGIHAFAGFYWNSTRMVDRAYQVAYGPDSPHRATRGRMATSIDDALVPSDYAAFINFADLGSHLTAMNMKPGAGLPWKDVPDLSHDRVVSAVVGWATAQARGLIGKIESEGILGRIAAVVPKLLERRIERALRKAMAHADAGNHDEVLAAFDGILGWLTDRALDGAHRKWSSARPLFFLVDLYRAIVRGLIVDKLFEDGHDIDEVDNENYSEWLTRHGLHAATMESLLPHMPALVCFAMPDGDGAQTPTMSASTYLLWELRYAFSQGSHYYFFEAGTGETVVTPAYQALLELGASFEFFHKLVGVTPSPDGQFIDELVFEVQARVKGGGPYEPLRPGAGDLGLVWPDRPLWDQLENGDEIRDAIAVPDEHLGFPTSNLESAYCPWKGVGEKRLRRGVDFDVAIIAMPPAAIEESCPELLEDPAVRQAAEGLPSVQTLQVQLWLKDHFSSLGWDVPVRATDRFTTVGIPDPLNAGVDFSDLLAFEGWTGPGAPKGLMHMCGPIQELDRDAARRLGDPTYAEEIWQRGAAITGQFLRSFGTVAPDASGNRGNNPRSFDFELLHDPDDSRRGEQRLRAQYIRTNIDPSERYVLSPAGSAASRPSPWDTKFQNLAVAGDWVYTGMNIGAFESAVLGGMLASYAVSGFPQPADIIGYSLFHSDPPTNDDGPLMDRSGVGSGAVVDLRAQREGVDLPAVEREATE